MAETIQMLTRSLDIIECLSTRKEGFRITDLAAEVGLHKSTVYRILSALQDRGYVRKDEESGKYRLTMKIVQLSSSMLNQVELRTESYPYLKALSTQLQQTVHLGMLKGVDIIYLEKVVPYDNSRMYSQIGHTFPAYRTGIGKAIIAHLPAREREEYLMQAQFLPHLPNTISSKEAFLRELAQIRANGYAVDNTENETGIRCIATVIRDYTGKTIAALSISGETEQIDDAFIAGKADLLKITALQISRELGYMGDGQFLGMESGSA